MSFDSNGTFNRLYSWQAHAAAGTKIRADYHDNEDDGFAAGLSNCITKDGRTQPLADIPMNGKKITNHGPTQTTDAPNTVATKGYVDNFKDFSTGMKINGAGPINGFINFTSPTGVNGIGWTTADMSWVGKVAEASKTRKRITANNAKDGTGSDVFVIDEGGFVNFMGYLTHNLSYDGSWRTIAAGTGTLFQMSSGAFNFESNDTATTSAYQTSTQRVFSTIANGAGSAQFSLRKSGTGKTNQMLFYSGTTPTLRWQMQMGDATAESSTRTGSNFALHSYANDGTAAVAEITINRATHLATFGGAITAAGTVTSGSNFDSTSTTCVVSATSGGAIYLRPDGPTVGTSGLLIDTNGQVRVCEGAVAATGGILAGQGIYGKNGSNGVYTGGYMNSYWDGTFLRMYVGASPGGYMGAVAWQCDYRIKRDVKPLPSMWEAVKALNPISYKQKAYEIFVDNDLERFGFFAHELQERLGKGAATGEKDSPEIQSPNLLGIIAALTKGLQEAMTRIEALEAR